MFDNTFDTSTENMGNKFEMQSKDEKKRGAIERAAFKLKKEKYLSGTVKQKGTVTT